MARLAKVVFGCENEVECNEMGPIIEMILVFGSYNIENWNGTTWFLKKEYSSNMSNYLVPQKM